MHKASREWVIQIKSKAESGDPQAQYLLSRCCLEGNGVEKDEVVGLAWLEESALRGHVEAQYDLGTLSQDDGDLRKGFIWIEKAALQGHKNAQLSLWSCYQNGKGVEQDPVKAAHWHQKVLHNTLAENPSPELAYVAANHQGTKSYEAAETFSKKENPSIPAWIHLPKMVVLPIMHLYGLYLLWWSDFGVLAKLFLTPLCIFIVGGVYNFCIGFPLAGYMMKKFNVK